MIARWRNKLHSPLVPERNRSVNALEITKLASGDSQQALQLFIKH